MQKQNRTTIKWLIIEISLVFILIIKLFPQIDYMEIPYSKNEITIDGELSDWSEFSEFSFKDTLSKFKFTGDFNPKELYPSEFDFNKMLLPRSRNEITVRSCWNKQFLFFALQVKDKHLFAEIKSRTDKPRIHMNDGIELYIDTQNDSPLKMDINDYQFIVDVLGESVVFRGDRKQILIDTVAVPKDFDQNVLFHSKAKYWGKINNLDNIDSSYTIEMKIPFAAIGIEAKTEKVMKLDICVNDVDYFAKEGTEVDEISTNLWSFNWSGFSDFGYPKYWKQAKLVGKPSFLEEFNEIHKNEWLWIYLVTFLTSVTIISLLFYRTIKLKQLPTYKEIEKHKSSINVKNNHSLSYNQKILQKVSEFVVTQKSEIPNSEEVSKQIGVSLRTLQRITKEELNLTPTNLIYIIKLQLAADYLKNKQGNVTDAAYEFGFSDPSYFSKLFKKHFEISPTEFIKQKESI